MNYVTWGFIFIWFVILLLDYINKHPGYWTSVEYFQYPKLYIFLSVFFGGLGLVYSKDRFDKWRLPVNGISLAIFSFILIIAISISHMNFAVAPTSSAELVHLITKAIVMLIGFTLFIMVMRSTGHVVYRRLLKDLINKNPILDIAMGLMVFVSILFLLGVMGQFKQNVIILVLFLMCVSNVFFLGKSMKSFFLKPMDLNGLSLLGVLSFCILSYVLIVHYLYNIAPFPSGFDSRNFYINISKLIAENNALVEGFQPYFWSIFIATGYAIFDRAEVALECSYLGLVLTVFAAYRFSRVRLKLDRNMVLFCLAIFVLIPAVANQMYTELKVDFAMLFFQILCLEYFLVLAKRLKLLDLGLSADLLRKNIGLVVLVGVLCSFALGIKLINMFLVFTIIVIIWWSSKDRYATIGILSLALLLFLYAGIDELSGLNKYHLSEPIVKAILALLMIGGAGMSFVKNRQVFIRKTIVTVVFLASTGVFILPWMIKNYSETKSLNPKTLLMGTDPGPKMNLRTMIKNFETNNNSQ